jgi:hypothetical protein
MSFVSFPSLDVPINIGTANDAFEIGQSASNSRGLGGIVMHENFLKIQNRNV